MQDALLSQSLVDLEWPEVKELIAAEAISELGKERARALGPADHQAAAEVRLAILGEVLALFDDGAQLPRSDLRDVREPVERARRHGVLSAEELFGVLRLLETALALSRFAAAHGERAPLLREALKADDELFELRRELFGALDEHGSLRDEASSELADARRELKRTRQKLSARLAELMQRYRDVLQDNYYAEREGRYVLPVRADAPYRVEGMVFGTSASGSTLYLEPKELAPLGNQLRLEESRVAREEARLCAEFSRKVGALADEVLWGLDLSVRGDLLAACAHYAAKTSSIVVPFGALGELEIVAGRHPLLAHVTKDVIPSDLSLGSGRGLVLSGPNAGGKTVALKMLGLVAVLQSAGLPVPVLETSRIGFFHRVLADIGDDQSLSQSLSTFSGHVERVKFMLEMSEPGVLILVDELMSGTDPNEGAVLAVSVLEEFVRRGAAALITTHYEALKLFAAEDPLLDNAAAGFDFERMAPTFVIEQGRPGASSALVVAEKFGLPRSVTRRAEALLPEADAKRRRDQLEVEQLRANLERERKELQSELERQRLLSHRVEVEAEKLKETRRNDLLRESDELRLMVREARSLVKQAKSGLKQGNDGDAVRRAEKQLDQAAGTISFGSDVEKASRKELPKTAPGRKYRIGEKVRVSGLTSAGEILEILPKDQLRIAMGVMKLTVGVSDVAPWGSAPVSKESGKLKANASNSTESRPRETPLRIEDTTCDLRGRRVEEGLGLVDSFLDELLRRQEVGGYVLHGHGTGAMKDAVRQHLRAHPVIEVSRACEREEGGDAFTVFWLRGMS